MAHHTMVDEVLSNTTLGKMTFKIEDAAKQEVENNADMKVKTSFAKKKRKATKISVFKNQFTSELKIVCLKKRLITDDDGEARQRAVLS